MAKAKRSQKKEAKEAAVQGDAIVQEAPAMQEGATASEPENQVPPADSDLEPEPTEPSTTYTAKVGVPLLVLRRVPNPENKPIGTLHYGMKVEVIDSRNGYAKLKNGTWVNESHLERQQ